MLEKIESKIPFVCLERLDEKSKKINKKKSPEKRNLPEGGACSNQRNDTTGKKILKDAQTNDKVVRRKCLVCRTNCRSALALKEHVSKHIFNVPVYQCKTCKGYFKDKRSLLMHRYQIHDDNSGQGYAYCNSYICTLCGRRFAKKLTCAEHIELHNSMVLECDGCGWMFDTSYRVHVHRALWHTYSKRNYKNKKQQANNGEVRNRPKHKPVLENQGSQVAARPKVTRGKEMDYSMLKPKRERFRCSAHRCKVITNTYENLTTHMRSVHRMSNQMCRICTRNFKRGSALEEHLQHHFSMKYECLHSGCGWMFERLQNLISHYSYRHNIHYKNRPLPMKYKSTRTCRICARNFNTDSALKYHLQRHNNMKFMCLYYNCRCMFEKLSHLKSHYTNLHKTKKACKYKLLMSHIKSVQSKADCSCIICNRSFITGSELNHHLQHHAAMKFICLHNSCGFMYEQFSELQSHYSAHHNAKLSISEAHQYMLQRDDISECEKSVHKLRNHTCKICTRNFITDSAFEYHLENHDRMNYICQHSSCGCMYEKFNQLQSHYTNRHKTKVTKSDAYKYMVKRDGTSECKNEHSDQAQDVSKAWQDTKQGNSDTCLNGVKDKGQRNLFDIGQEMLTGHDESTSAISSMNLGDVQKYPEFEYRCRHDECDWLFETYSEFEKHTVEKHGILGNPIGRKTCKLKPIDRYQNANKMQCRDTGNDQVAKRYQCPYKNCRFHIQDTFEEVDNLISHMAAAHGQKNRVCQICDRILRTEKERTQHIRNHANMRYKCLEESCGWTYETFLLLYGHYYNRHKLNIKREHENLYKIKAEAKSDEQQKAHYKNMQQKDDKESYRYRKPEMNREPKKMDKDARYGLRSRKTTKPNKYKYLCPLVTCKAGYEEFSELEKHLKSLHKTTDGVCPICSRMFLSKNVYRVHLQKHADVTTWYKCAYDGWMYHDFGTLRSHYTNEHRITMASDDSDYDIIRDAILCDDESTSAYGSSDSEHEEATNSKQVDFQMITKRSTAHIRCAFCNATFDMERELEDHHCRRDINVIGTKMKERNEFYDTKKEKMHDRGTDNADAGHRVGETRNNVFAVMIHASPNAPDLADCKSCCSADEHMDSGTKDRSDGQSDIINNQNTSDVANVPRFNMLSESHTPSNSDTAKVGPQLLCGSTETSPNSTSTTCSSDTSDLFQQSSNQKVNTVERSTLVTIASMIPVVKTESSTSVSWSGLNNFIQPVSHVAQPPLDVTSSSTGCMEFHDHR